MKTAKHLRNTALMLMLAATGSFVFSQGNDELNREKAEFAAAGFWIDAVVVTAPMQHGDRELLAGRGYYIEPVIITYNTNDRKNDATAPVQFADRELLGEKGYYIEPVVIIYNTGDRENDESPDKYTRFDPVQAMRLLEASMIDVDQAR